MESNASQSVLKKRDKKVSMSIYVFNFETVHRQEHGDVCTITP